MYDEEERGNRGKRKEEERKWASRISKRASLPFFVDPGREKEGRKGKIFGGEESEKRSPRGHGSRGTCAHTLRCGPQRKGRGRKGGGRAAKRKKGRERWAAEALEFALCTYLYIVKTGLPCRRKKRKKEVWRKRKEKQKGGCIWVTYLPHPFSGAAICEGWGWGENQKEGKSGKIASVHFSLLLCGIGGKGKR